MKKFIQKLTVVITLLLVASTGLQFLISWWIKDKSINGRDNFHIIKNQTNDIVFLGSSRCAQHYDPSYFRDSLGLKAVNLGTNGHGDLTMQTLRMKYYLSHNPPPKIAMLNFGPVSSHGSVSIEGNRNFVDKNFYARYAFFPQNEDLMIVNYFHFNWAERYIPLFALLRYRAIKQCIDMKGGKLMKKYGFQPQTGIWDPASHPNDSARYNYSVYLRNYDIIKKRMAVFNEYCKRNNIALVVVQSPMYRKSYDKIAFDLTGRMCKELGILFIETNADSIIDDHRNFVDHGHLNTTGVPKMLNIVVKNPEFLELLRNLKLRA